MASLLTGDLHLTDDPDHAYRFNLFPWLIEQAKKHSVAHAFILGDLTDAKDRHSAALVNRIVDSVMSLLSAGLHVHILRGNHDGTDPNTPFFRFLGSIEHPNLCYYHLMMRTTLSDVVDKGKSVCVFLPHSRNPLKDYDGVSDRRSDLIFMHQTVDGAVAENGAMLSGIPRGAFGGARRGVYSGDVHVPQQIGPVTYVGAPYHIRFGDTFTPRVLMLMDGGTYDLFFRTVEKKVFRISSEKELAKLKAAPGDHVRVVLDLEAEDVDTWKSLRRAVHEHAEAHQWRLFGVPVERPKAVATEQPVQRAHDPVSSVVAFCNREKVPPRVRKYGLRLLGDA